LQKRLDEIGYLKIDMELLNQRSESATNKEMSLIIKERDELKEEVQALMQYYLKTKEINKDKDTISQYNKSKELINEINDMLKVGHGVLKDKHVQEDIVIDDIELSEVERQCKFLKKAMREIYSPTTNILIEIFGSPENIMQLQTNKDYVGLLVFALKVISKMIITENAADRKTYPEERSSTELKESEALHKKNENDTYNDIEDTKKLNEQRKAYYMSQGNKNSIQIGEIREEIQDNNKGDITSTKNIERKQMYLIITQKNTKLNLNRFTRNNLSITEIRPAFNNYTKRTTDYFDPFLQFGGESL